jgi:hypothetical protein
MRETIENTVIRLFRTLEAEGIRYAVLRNYELFPTLKRAAEASPHTDIDLVVDSRDLDSLRDVMAGIAEEHGWDALNECDHWAQSAARHHNIEVFRFHRTQPLEYLQVDVFHGYVLLGLPLYDEAQMLAGRIHDAARGLTRVDAVKENVYRMIQIHGLYPASERKRARYRAGVLAFRASNRDAMDRALTAQFGRFGVPAADALALDDTRLFMRNMRLGRLRFILKFALRRPFSFMAYQVCRLREHILRFRTRQCGLVLRVSVRDESQRPVVRGVMDELVRNSFMDEWREKEAGARTSKKDHAAMEQGAIVIEWSKPDQADTDLREIDDRTAIADMILRVGARHHKPLFLRDSAEISATAAEATAQ